MILDEEMKHQVGWITTWEDVAGGVPACFGKQFVLYGSCSVGLLELPSIGFGAEKKEKLPWGLPGFPGLDAPSTFRTRKLMDHMRGIILQVGLSQQLAKLFF